MYNLIKSLFKKREAAPSTPKEYTFSVLEGTKIGDQYTYTVQANSKKEAFNKLVKYFYGEFESNSVQSEHKQVHWPNQSVFETNMPLWFAKRINGQVRDDKNDYQKMLEEYALENNITLKK